MSFSTWWSISSEFHQQNIVYWPCCLDCAVIKPGVRAGLRTRPLTNYPGASIAEASDGTSHRTWWQRLIFFTFSFFLLQRISGLPYVARVHLLHVQGIILRDIGHPNEITVQQAYLCLAFHITPRAFWIIHRGRAVQVGNNDIALLPSGELLMWH